MFDKIKDTLRFRILNSKLKKQERDKQVSSLKTAKTIGIVCLVDEEDNWNIIQKTIKCLQVNGAKVSVLGIFFGNIKPLWYVETLSISICMDKELRFLQIPKGIHAEEFMEEEFDILIDFTLTDLFPAFYTSTTSKAKFKIGLDTELKRKHFDMLLRMENPSMQDYSNHVVSYLSKINT